MISPEVSPASRGNSGEDCKQNDGNKTGDNGEENQTAFQ